MYGNNEDYVDKENLRFFNKQYNYEFFDNIKEDIFYICLDTGNIFYNCNLYDRLEFPYKLLNEKPCSYKIKIEALSDRLNCDRINTYNKYFAKNRRQEYHYKKDEYDNIIGNATYNVVSRSEIKDTNTLLSEWLVIKGEEYPIKLYSNELTIFMNELSSAYSTIYKGNEFVGNLDDLMNNHLEILDEDDWLSVKNLLD